MMRARQVIPDLPAPRVNAKPDLSGFWSMTNDPFPEQPEPQPWAAELFAERKASFARDMPSARCLPGHPTGARGWTKFVHTPELLVMLMEGVPGFRQVFLDGRKHPQDPNPSWLGHSVGWWEGDTLVVDTVGYNDRGWLNMFPVSEKLHVTERFTRSEYGLMAYTAVFHDPEVFEAAWTHKRMLDLAPQEEIMETVCENNKW